MCYKVAVTSDRPTYETRFNATYLPESEHKIHFHANGFAHPSLPVITQKEPNAIRAFEWGMVPHFAKDTATASKLRKGNLNAKSETVFELKTWKPSISKRRCLILADGFYESRDVNGTKYPYYIYRKDRQPFAFAGIYNPWKDENGYGTQPLQSLLQSQTN